MDIITLAEVAGNLSVIGYGIGTLGPGTDRLRRRPDHLICADQQTKTDYVHH